MLKQCPCWQPDQYKGADDKDAGKDRHVLLKLILQSTVGWPGPADWNAVNAIKTTMPESDVSAVEWAADYIDTHAPNSDFPGRLEYHVNPLDADFRPLFAYGGTLDVACGNELFDLKWRERDYGPQMAAYALDLFQEHGWQEVKIHLLFGEPKRAQVFTLDEAGAEKLVFGIVDKVRDPAKQPTPCDYCGWCARRLTCPALVGVAERVAVGYSDIEKVKSWHPSQMETGDELGLALWVWRTILKKWGESVEYHALEAAQRKGLTIAGFEQKSKSGKAYVANVVEAFKLCGLPQDDFLAGCQVRLNTSKKYPDQVGLTDLYAKFHGIKPTPAKKDLLKKLEPVVKKTRDSVYLKAVKAAGDEEESEE